MSRFRFSMQSILDVKEKLETQAKLNFAMAQAALTREQECLEALEARKAEYESQLRGYLKGSLQVQKIEEARRAILVMEDQISHQREVVSLAERKVQRAREDMSEAMKERKTYETLKDNAFQEFLQEENRAEGKTVDELVSYSYGQKQKTKPGV